ncbi:hypothetical protein BDW62DRAFT_206038 [Aspergillus aurantiobrunneus]
MDHFIIPKGAHHLQVPYLCSEPFRGELSNYREHNGWTRHELKHDPNFGGKHPDQIVPFLQNYLFFGTLARIFEIHGVDFNVSDWIRLGDDGKCPVVTTAPLLVELTRVEARIADETVSPATKSQWLGLINDSMSEMHEFVTDRFEHVEAYLSRWGTTPGSRQWPLISLSITALGWTLDHIMRKIYRSAKTPGAAKFTQHEWRSSLLEQRVEDRGWSKRDLGRDGTIKLDGWYFVGFLECPRRHQNCRDCQDPKCSRRFLNDDDYIVRHVSEQVAKVLRDGKTPLVSWADSKLTVVGTECQNAIYVAISHVWSDGMGNPKANALPTCLLFKIQSMINSLYSIPHPEQERKYLIFGPRNPLSTRDATRQPIGFWMDTLCVPVHDIEAKKQAITEMRTIYEWADRTLVLDAWIRELPLASDIVERAARIVLSNWQFRLWTLQEGVLAHNLFIQFHDEACPLQRVVDEWGSTDKDRRELSFHGSFGTALLTVPLLGLRFSSRPPLNVPLHFPAVVAGTLGRTTTKRSDETICLATMLEINPGPLLSIPGRKPAGMTAEQKAAWEEKACEQRMEKLLEIMGAVSARIVFSNLPRMKSEGFRWAPRSYIDRAGTKLPGAGLDPKHKLDDGVVRPGRGGLGVKCAGMVLEPLADCIQASAIAVQQDSGFQVVLSLMPDDGPPPELSGSVDYAVLSYAPVPGDGRRPRVQTEAILGVVEGKDEDEYTVRYVCRAGMWWEAGVIESYGELPAVAGHWVRSNKWCIK